MTPKKHLFMTSFILLVANCMVSCQTKLPPEYKEWIDPVIPGDLPKVSFYESVNDFNAFALESYANIIHSNKDENIVYSPYAMAIDMEILRLGAHGKTARNIEKCLLLPASFDIDSTQLPLFEYTPPSPQKEPAIHYPPVFLLNHSIWFSDQIRLRKGYRERTTRDYHVEFFPVDFSLPSTIILKEMNNWCYKSFQGKAPPIISPLPNDTTFWLLGTLYFKAHWKNKFQHHKTQDRNFTLISGETVLVPVMQESVFNFKYTEDDDVQVLEMPYFSGESGDFSMLFFLPKVTDGILEFETEFNVNKYETLINSLQDKKVEVFIPKFSIEQETDLTEIVEDEFWINSDFSDMIEPPVPNIYKAKATQRISLAIDEHGTEVSLLAQIGYVSLDNENPIFDADHPFMFAIREMNTSAILFLGRIMNPVRLSETFE